MGMGFPFLKEIVPIVRSVVVQESHTQPWPQICGLICSLQAKSAPKDLRKVLEKLSEIKPNEEEAALGWIARTYLLNYYFENGEKINEGDLTAYERMLPQVALRWWKDYGMKERFITGCSKDGASVPVCVLPFDFA
tara:strand:+ start:37 stop:444 length:408 start_codon:yes stop_codon:yes gene_type:complete